MNIVTRFFKLFFDEWEEKGVSVPLMYDPVADRASLTILFPYISFWLTVGSLIGLHFVPAMWPASVGCGMLWLVSTILYMIRKLSKAKIDFDDKTLELDSGEESPKDTSTVGSNVTPDPV